MLLLYVPKSTYRIEGSVFPFTFTFPAQLDIIPSCSPFHPEDVDAISLFPSLAVTENNRGSETATKPDVSGSTPRQIQNSIWRPNPKHLKVAATAQQQKEGRANKCSTLAATTDQPQKEAVHVHYLLIGK